jgi:hypothetical protein
MPVSNDNDGAWLDPKWIVSACALAAFGLIMNYDLRLGIAAGIVLGVIGAVWLYIALRYGSLSGGPASGRSKLVTRVRAQISNRRLATARAAQPPASGAQQRPEPPQRP